MIRVGYCANCGQYYGRKYANLSDLYDDDTSHLCQKQEVKL